jgi:hypothetical protein
MASVRKTTRTESSTITRRLIAAMPASRFEMETLCRLAGIEATHSVPTAAVECKRRPRLLINPEFVRKYCERDEHLFLLVMHELWHVLLAHTRMYPRMTTIQNIAFDAVINSGLMREFDGAEYRGFFDAINPPDKFPGCLLRPPEGWPYAPKYPDDVGPPGTKELLVRLYPPGNLAFYDPPMYEEVLSLLLKSGMEWFGETPLLLGNHDIEEMHDPLLKEIMKQVSEKWPAMPMLGRGSGGAVNRHNSTVSSVGENVRRSFSQILRICVAPRPGRERRKKKVPVSSMGGTGVVPNSRDRLAPARLRLGIPNTLWAQPTNVNARVPERPSKAYVYFDVSGSMYQILPYLLGLMIPYVANKHADVFQFSTRVADMSIKDLRSGHLTTTGGTNINCVMEHLLALKPKPDRVLLLTDGEVGAPTASYTRNFEEAGIKLYVVLPHDGNLNFAVEDLATLVVRLPQLH